MMRIRGLLLLVALTGTACGALDWEAMSARAEFAREFVCPQDRVVVTGSLVQAPEREPPADIATDPERLRMWRAAEAYQKPGIFTAHGCGASRTYHCSFTGGYGSSHLVCQ